MLGSQRFKCCGSGQSGCELSTALGRSDESGEGEKDGAELPREELEDVEGESGGVRCLSLVWSKGQRSIRFGTCEVKGKRTTGAGEGELGGGRCLYRNKKGWRLDGEQSAPAPRNDCSGSLLLVAQ